MIQWRSTDCYEKAVDAVLESLETSRLPSELAILKCPEDSWGPQSRCDLLNSIEPSHTPPGNTPVVCLPDVLHSYDHNSNNCTYCTIHGDNCCNCSPHQLNNVLTPMSSDLHCTATHFSKDKQAYPNHEEDNFTNAGRQLWDSLDDENLESELYSNNLSSLKDEDDTHCDLSQFGMNSSDDASNRLESLTDCAWSTLEQNAEEESNAAIVGSVDVEGNCYSDDNYTNYQDSNNAVEALRATDLFGFLSQDKKDTRPLASSEFSGSAEYEEAIYDLATGSVSTHCCSRSAEANLDRVCVAYDI